MVATAPKADRDMQPTKRKKKDAMKRTGSDNRRGFTLVEVIVVLVVLAIMAAILIPSMVNWIQRAKDKTAIVGCRTCVLAAQTILSERYAIDGANAAVTAAETLALADVAGTVGVIATRPVAAVAHLSYTLEGVTVVYCSYADGACHPETYNINGSQSYAASSVFSSLDSLLQKAQNPTGYQELGATQPFVGGKIDGVQTGLAGSYAYLIAQQMTAEQKAFLNNVSWTIAKSATNRNRYDLYFTTTNYGAASATGVEVYRYNFDTQTYDRTTEGVVTDGMVSDRRTGTPANSTWTYDLNVASPF